MTYDGIIRALPVPVQEALFENLDSFVITGESSREEVSELITNAVRLTKLSDAYLAIEDLNKKQIVDDLLSAVPMAGTDAVFN